MFCFSTKCKMVIISSMTCEISVLSSMQRGAHSISSLIPYIHHADVQNDALQLYKD